MRSLYIICISEQLACCDWSLMHAFVIPPFKNAYDDDYPREVRRLKDPGN